MRPSGFIIDVPVTLTVAIRGNGLTEAKAKQIARKLADDLSPTEDYTKGYSDVIAALNLGVTVTEATLESSREESCEVVDELEADDADED